MYLDIRTKKNILHNRIEIEQHTKYCFETLRSWIWQRIDLTRNSSPFGSILNIDSRGYEIWYPRVSVSVSDLLSEYPAVQRESIRVVNCGRRSRNKISLQKKQCFLMFIFNPSPQIPKSPSIRVIHADHRINI